VFSGKLSQSWLRLQGDGYIWGASIVEILLGKIIELWKLRKDEVHGITEEI
jgi:hypothetical protein